MECVGARTLAATAVTDFPSWSSSRKNYPVVNRYSFSNLRCGLCRVKASGGGAGSGIESCVAVREDFADKEDFVKAGGSEILYVQMQQNKDMDEQSKLVDKVSQRFAVDLFAKITNYPSPLILHLLQTVHV